MQRVKICCIKTLDEAKLAIESGASALGLVSKMPSGPGIITEDQIKYISAQVPNAIDTFLLTRETSSKSIIQQLQKVLTSTVQLVDTVDIDVYDDIRRILPKVKIVQVVHVVDEESLVEALSIEPYVDAILLDSGRANSSVLGGTGKKHDWKISRNICRQVRKPVYLAGGLNSDNILEAISYVQPYGVDLCSGIRSNGKLDKKKVELFFDVLKGGAQTS